MIRLRPGFILLLLLSFCPAQAAPSPLQEKVRAWRVAHERELIDEYREFVAIPNITIDRANIRRNADFIVGMLQRRGVEARLLTLPSPNANPVVYGEVNVPGATRTIMFYAHYDGQPVNPAQWAPGGGQGRTQRRALPQPPEPGACGGGRG